LSQYGLTKADPFLFVDRNHDKEESKEAKDERVDERITAQLKSESPFFFPQA
jgi:hypothetical protein